MFPTDYADCRRIIDLLIRVNQRDQREKNSFI